MMKWNSDIIQASVSVTAMLFQVMVELIFQLLFQQISILKPL